MKAGSWTKLRSRNFSIAWAEATGGYERALWLALSEARLVAAVVNPRQVREETGVYGHKPTWGRISTRGHAPTGIMTPTDISAVGPMARHAEDLDLALRAAAGPDLLQRPAWRVEFPRRLGEFRVTV